MTQPARLPATRSAAGVSTTGASASGGSVRPTSGWVGRGRRLVSPPLVAPWVKYALLLTGAAVMVTPFLYMLSTSFKAQAFVLTFPPQFVPDPATVDNYTYAWGSQSFGRYFVNSLLVAVSSTVLSLWLSSMMAFGLARFQFRGRELIFRTMLVGLMVPAMMLIVPQFILARHLGLLDSLTGLVLFYVAGSLPLNVFLLRAFFESIPRELEQAMEVDGAGAWTRYARLAVPLSRPALATAAIFTFLASWDEFAWALTIINDPDKRTLPIAIQLFHGQNATQWGIVFAAATISVIPVLVVFFAMQRHFVQGLTSGAVKG